MSFSLQTEQIYLIFLKENSQQSSTVILTRLKITVNTIITLGIALLYTNRKKPLNYVFGNLFKRNVNRFSEHKKIVNILKEVISVCVKNPHF